MAEVTIVDLAPEIAAMVLITAAPGQQTAGPVLYRADRAEAEIMASEAVEMIVESHRQVMSDRKTGRPIAGETAMKIVGLIPEENSGASTVPTTWLAIAGERGATMPERFRWISPIDRNERDIRDGTELNSCAT